MLETRAEGTTPTHLSSHKKKYLSHPPPHNKQTEKKSKPLNYTFLSGSVFSLPTKPL